MVEPSQIQDIASNQGSPRTTINAAFAIIRALLPSSAEKTAISNIATGANEMYATSTTSQTIGNGSKTFTTIGVPRSFLLALPYVQIADRDDATKWMTGKVTSFIGNTLIVTIDDFGGTGTRANWIIGIAGRRGA